MGFVGRWGATTMGKASLNAHAPVAKLKSRKANVPPAHPGPGEQTTEEEPAKAARVYKLQLSAAGSTAPE